MRIPDHIQESEVLALIEGDMASVDPERRDLVREAVAGDPVLSRLVEEIRADASAVVSMSRVSAPAGLRARVIEELRRPVPRPELVREPAGGEIPVSSVIVSRENPWRRFFENGAARKLAAAATLTLAAGVGILLISNAARNGSTPSRTGPIALAPNPVAPGEDPSAPFEPITIDPRPGPMLATNDSEPVDSLIAEPLRSDPFALLGRDREPVVEMPVTAPLAHGMSALEAIELARAGKLIIRVRAVDEASARADIQDFAAKTAKELKWRPLEAWELAQVTVALRTPKPTTAPYAAANPPAKTNDTTSKAPNEKPVPPPVEPTGTAKDVADALREADFRPLYTVEMDENDRDLAKLLERLTGDKTHVAEFVALEEPLPALVPSTEPAAVLWWTRPPSSWTRRVSVPIVLETLPEAPPR